MKLITKILLTSSIFLGFAFVFSMEPASAAIDASKQAACQGVEGCGNGSAVSNAIKNIINLLSAIIGVVAVIIIIFNGFRFITSGGDSNAISSARRGIIFAIVGLIVVVLAQVIVRFVIGKV